MSRSSAATPRKDPSTGKWFFVVDVGVKPDGTRRQAYRRGFRTKAEAQEELDRLRGDRRDGTFVSPLRQRFGDFLTDDWLPTIHRELARSTWEDYERKVRNHVLPHLGRIPIQALDAVALNRFYTHLLEQGRLLGKQSPGLKPRTVRYIHTIVHAALDDAVRWRRIKLNPADQANPPSSSESKPPEMTAWTREQLLRFLALCEGDRYYYPWFFLATTGCRRGEALGLRWHDVDLGEAPAHATIRQECIPLTKPSGKGREGCLVTRTKSHKPRVIELDTQTVAVLEAWKTKHDAERELVGAGYEDHGLIFCRPDGRPYHPEAFSKTFDRRLRQPKFAALPTIRLHDLRHTWATLALVAGVDIRMVSERLGHSSILVTSQTYQHVRKGMQADAAQKVADLIFGSTLDL
ncbi:MAG: site-specific integrase [Acidobacteriota bacterium]|nr:site-specific integrase [Acidobacteriota bacterium]